MRSASQSVHLFDLPKELFDQILRHALDMDVSVLKYALMLRLVNRLFSTEIHRVVTTYGLLDEFLETYREEAKIPIATTYVEARVRQKASEKYPMIRCIRDIAEKLAPRKDDVSRYITVLSHRAAKNTFNIFRNLHPTLPVPCCREFNSDFDANFISAAIYMDRFDVVSAWTAPIYHNKDTLFGNDMELATEFASLDINKHLLHIHNTDWWRNHALSDAARYGRLDLVKMIYHHAIEQNPWRFVQGDESSKNDNSHLTRALVTPSLEVRHYIMSLIRTHGIIVDDWIRRRVMKEATAHGWTEMFNHVLQDDPNEQDWPDLLNNAASSGDMNLFKFLLDSGAEPSASALRRAAVKGHIAIAQILIERGVDPTDLSVVDCNLIIADMLLRAGADPNDEKERKEREAERRDEYEDEGEEYEEDPDWDWRYSCDGSYDHSQIGYAILDGHIEMIELLLKHGARPPTDVEKSYCNATWDGADYILKWLETRVDTRSVFNKA